MGKFTNTRHYAPLGGALGNEKMLDPSTAQRNQPMFNYKNNPVNSLTRDLCISVVNGTAWLGGLWGTSYFLQSC